MADMTMGQRIAERRRMLGLSQEGLGEKMGVSRQAISKWEADTATPEIEKLIALSALFGVSVGWLLGTEEEPFSPEGEEGFSEEQMKMIEEIVRRYQQLPVPQPTRHSPAQTLMTAVAVIAAAAAVIFCGWNLGSLNNQLSGLRGEIERLQSRYSYLESDVRTLGDELDQLSAAQEKSDDLLSEFTLEASPWEDMMGASIRFSGVPKTTQAEEQVFLCVRQNGVEVLSQPCERDSIGYTATVELSAGTGYSYHFLVVYQSGDSKQQTLVNDNSYEFWELTDLEGCLSGNAGVNHAGWGWDRQENTIVFYQLWCHAWPPDMLVYSQQRPRWKQLDLVLYHNGTELYRDSALDKAPVPAGDLPPEKYVNELSADWEFLDLECKLPALKEGDILELRVEAALSDGMPFRSEGITLLLEEEGLVEFITLE